MDNTHALGGMIGAQVHYFKLKLNTLGMINGGHVNESKRPNYLMYKYFNSKKLERVWTYPDWKLFYVLVWKTSAGLHISLRLFAKEIFTFQNIFLRVH